MGGGLESRCVSRVCGVDGAVHGMRRMHGQTTLKLGIPFFFNPEMPTPKFRWRGEGW